MLQGARTPAIVPKSLEAYLLLGGAVLLDYGTPMDEVYELIEKTRLETWSITDNGSNFQQRSLFGSLPQVDSDIAAYSDEEEVDPIESENGV